MALPGGHPEVLSIIPGVALGASEDERHAFIQVISSREGRSWNIHFPYETFKADKKKLRIEIADNYFSTEEIVVNIHHEDLVLIGRVQHSGTHSFPVTLSSPGIMGWYAYVPFMECFHGVVSTSHTLWGSLTLNGKKLDMHGGIGYIEKDWGTSFPEAWIWMQSNCFESQDLSCMLSVAKVPFLGHVFPGFLGFITHGDKLIRFGTYTGARITHLESSETQMAVQIQTKEHQITFFAELGPASKLVAPRQGKMVRPLLESIMGTITLTLKDKDGALLIEETGTMAGIELSEATNLKID